jgi:hypothetical protein
MKKSFIFYFFWTNYFLLVNFKKLSQLATHFLSLFLDLRVDFCFPEVAGGLLRLEQVDSGVAGNAREAGGCLGAGKDLLRE